MPPGTRHADAHHEGPRANTATIPEPLTNGASPHSTHRPQHHEHEKDRSTTQKSRSHDQGAMDAKDTQGQEHSQDPEDTEEELDQQQIPKPDGPTHGTKRKASSSEDSPHKAARRESLVDGQASKHMPSMLSAIEQLKLLNFLLSPSSLPFARPKEEAEDLKNRPNGGARTRTYAASPFTPFEELLNSLILSRPIGHMLGVRSIRTLLNPPYNLMSPKLIKDLGADGVRQALDKARTQHRQKTAEEIVLLADAVTDTLGEDHFDVSLERVREQCGHDMEKERKMIQDNVKGMGKTGLDIFGRRIQGSWGEWYPFADQKTSDALEQMGLPRDAEQLKSLLEEHWKELNAEDVIGDGEERKRRIFVRVLERAIGAELEGNLDEMKAKALE